MKTLQHFLIRQMQNPLPHDVLVNANILCNVMLFAFFMKQYILQFNLLQILHKYLVRYMKNSIAATADLKN